MISAHEEGSEGVGGDFQADILSIYTYKATVINRRRSALGLSLRSLRVNCAIGCPTVAVGHFLLLPFS